MNHFELRDFEKVPRGTPDISNTSFFVEIVLVAVHEKEWGDWGDPS